MPRIPTLEIDQAPAKSKEMLEGVQKKLGKVPNIFKTMANSPAVLGAYFGMSEALNNSSLSGGLREQIALAVGQANNCDYCVAAHTAIGKSQGLSEADTIAARKGAPSDPKAAAAVKFAQKLVQERGWVNDDDVEGLRSAGFSDGEVAEVVGVVALNLFTNYYNHAIDPEVDFPAPPALS